MLSGFHNMCCHLYVYTVLTETAMAGHRLAQFRNIRFHEILSTIL